MSALRLVLVGQRGGTHVGESLAHAAEESGHQLIFLAEADAHHGSALRRRLAWRLAGRRPVRLAAFGRAVAETCAAARAEALVCTGHAPVDADALERIGRQGTRRIGFVTDDPWNRRQYARWYLRALPHYDHLFSPRRANLDDFRTLGCREVSYLPFAYDPRYFFPEPPDAQARERLACEVLFVGGADDDRVPVLSALTQAGLKPAIYGGYWDRVPALRPHWRGMASADILRQATSAADINLCLVRRANRDDHVMRSYEIAACGGCALAQDTPAHRRIFGEDGAIFFTGAGEMITGARRLLADPGLRERIGAAAHRRVADGGNTYRDRLATMLAAVRSPGAAR